MKIRSINDFAFGSFLAVAGGIGHWLTRDLPIGSMGGMGSGFMPRALCWMIIGIGALLMLRSLRLDEPRPQPISWRPLTLILLSIGLFAFATPILGLPIGAILLVLVAAAADPSTQWIQTMILAGLLALFCSIVFVRLLEIPMPLLPGFAI